jgi:hypothetical protein
MLLASIAIIGLVMWTPITQRLLAQDGPTPTAAVITLPLAPTATSATLVPTPTLPATQPPGAFLEAITEANVRSQADPNADLLGTIRAGETYEVIGRFFRWYRFRYPLSPDRTGWVFEQLVNVTGDIASITDLASLPTATLDPVEAARVQTLEAVTLTPGGLITLTAEALVIPLPVQGQPQTVVTQSLDLPALEQSAPLPTFTPPPQVALLPPENAYAVNRPLPSESDAGDDGPVTRQITGTLPPIVPIGLLLGAGLLGLIISAGMRR